MSNIKEDMVKKEEIVEPVIEITEPVEEITYTAPAPQIEVVSEPKPLYNVKVIHSSLRRRTGPSTAYDVAGIISDQGHYDIYEIQDNWGKLENGNWINLDYTDFPKK